jgi:two-component system phosphate regulon response regulator OmpR
LDTKILIIDDDARFRDLIKEYLQGYGFIIYHHDEGTGAMNIIEQLKPDLVLLDLMLPGIDGMEILRDIRLKFAVPVIMLTARGDDTDRIVGLELGADDYLSKPFNPRELLARIKAVMRRYSPENTDLKGAGNEHLITAGEITLNPATMVMEFRGGKEELSKTEFRIMEALMKNPNTVLSRDTIMNIARGRDFIAFDRSIDVHVSKLRYKLENLCGDKNRIKTVWGTGYMFVL